MQKNERYGAILMVEADQLRHEEYFSEHDLLGVVKETRPQHFISIVFERSERMKVEEKEIEFWSEIYGLEAVSKNLNNAISHIQSCIKEKA